MRYQQLTYIQNNNNAIRNKNILNVNTSSDISIFNPPSFNMTGATKLNCTGTTTGTTYVITSATTIPLTFNFTGNTNYFIDNNATFKYEIYKYNDNINLFTLPPVYTSDIISYSGFSGTSIVNDFVPITNLNIDGEYLIKPYYNFDVNTGFLSKLGKKVDTKSFINGTSYGLYDSNFDYYFIAFKAADKPKLLTGISNLSQVNQLLQEVIQPKDKQTTLYASNVINGDFILTLNGLILAKGYDYSLSGNVITLNQSTNNGDIVTLTYTTKNNNKLSSENIQITSSITSGITNNQGSNNVYFNTTTNKYEIYTSVQPLSNGLVMVMINGVTIANNIDYYQSISNQKRIILEGNLLIGDIITMVYSPITDVVNGVTSSNPTISWTIDNEPKLVNGTFTIETSSDSTFNVINTGSSQTYKIGKTLYNDNLSISGSVGTKIYYRVKNEKKFVNLCGISISSVQYSDAIPITIQTNSINNY
jgi:hypothetical protein